MLETLRNCAAAGLALVAGAFFTSPAHATTCPADDPILSELTCSSTVSGQITMFDGHSLGALPPDEQYSCGIPTAPLPQVWPEDVYSFTCQNSGLVSMTLYGLDCDLDIYILDSTCDPYAGCVAGTTNESLRDSPVSFTCSAGQTYYVVVEGVGYSPSVPLGDACNLGEGNYSISFDVSAGTGCSEDCDDVTDNDFDGTIDCDDSDCAGDPLCDFDFDDDGYNDIPHGGTDCNDANAAIHPGAEEYCNGIDDNCNGTIDESTAIDAYTYYRDADGDTYGNTAVTVDSCTSPSGYVLDDTDCDDSRSTTNPAATELCDGRDNDCDGSVDEGLSVTWYRDADGDTFGNYALTSSGCSAPAGYVSNSTDCNDASASTHPGALEICNSLDDDCDGAVDDGLGSTWYRDADGDSYGSSTVTTTSCTTPAGYVANSTDCNDASAAVNPAAAEVCNSIDDNCNGGVDDGVGSTWYRDSDGDGYGSLAAPTTRCVAPIGYVANSTDCNDALSSIHPGAAETCNGVDDDCDASVDEGIGSTWYRDADGDTYGTSGVTATACSAPTGYIANATDCNDGSAGVHPGATELCNSIDDDCDGSVDEGVSATWYRDADSDGYGASATTTADCTAPAGYVANDADCDDTRAAVNPTALESCNSRDDDCDGLVDEAGGPTWYRDADGDAYGTASGTTTACTTPAGYVSTATDCDDTRATVHPGAAEVCDGLDNDCNGAKDETGGTTWYADADTDGFGNVAATTLGCTAPSGYVAGSTDCDDTRATTYPGASELCDSRDNDCDGSIDEGVGATWYLDADGDSYGSPSVTTASCTTPVGYVANDDDCDDTRGAVSPAGTEVCNSRDDDCDGLLDEAGGATWYRDADGDSYGNVGATTTACTTPAGYVPTATDCDDTNATVNPGATELCDGLDNDCDTLIDETGGTTWYADADADGFGNVAVTTFGCGVPPGYTSTSTDCDDTQLTTHPGAPELCDARDNDCDGSVDEGLGTTWYRDADGDAYGDYGVTTSACAQPSGYVATATDCNGTVDEGLGTVWYRDVDSDGYGNPGAPATNCTVPTGYVANATDCDDATATVHPGAAETCNSVDDDCDGTVDDGIGSTWYADADGDGYGNVSVPTTSCTAPVGFVANTTDCNDSLNTVHPGAAEVCNSVDDDCDGSVDEGIGSTWYSDTDGDSYGNASLTTLSCAVPSGYVADATDCNDAAAGVHPGASELCNRVDDDCDGTIDEGVVATYFLDADNDGYGTSTTPTTDCSVPSGYVANDDDCDDTRGGVNPAATEVCNSRDDDCDSLVDEAGGATWYADADADTYGDATVTNTACTTPPGFVALSSDCDDTHATVYPGAAEVCDSLDNDCDSLIDETGGATWYADVDGDGFGTPTITTTGCTAPTGYVASYADCDDSRASVNPAGIEVCDGLDDDCDGAVDETGGTIWYVDADNDGHGNPAVTSTSCTQPVGTVAVGGDCDDTRSVVYPGAAEVCDSLDNDCNGTIDEAGGSVWYADADADGYGDAAVAQTECVAPWGYLADDTDCDDSVATIHPDAAEACNSLDDDCDGLVDEDATDAVLWYADADGDSHGDPEVTEVTCVAPVDYVANADDCWDDDAAVYPGAPETADGVDEDCDGIVDEVTGDFDDDGDGYTEGAGDCDDDAIDVSPDAVESCDRRDEDCDGVTDNGTSCYDDDRDGYAESDADCNDGDAAISPAGAEVPDNGIDDDCDGIVDTGVYDGDEDGYSEGGADCDDTNAAVHPDAPEREDGVDNDCDGIIDEDTATSDDDGDGVAEDEGDCNDADDAINRYATDVPNGVDDDCDGIVDEGTEVVDDDGDGFSEDAGDCDDANGAVSPAATETGNGTDDDCDGTVDEGVNDADGDGFGSSNGDCDDNDGWKNPTAEDVCDGKDNNCDGIVDNGCDGATEAKVEAAGCGCGAVAAPSGVGSLLVLLGLGAAVRRRRAA